MLTAIKKEQPHHSVIRTDLYLALQLFCDKMGLKIKNTYIPYLSIY
jgi:hypothetical protein